MRTYTLLCCVLLFTAFCPPKNNNPTFSKLTKIFVKGFQELHIPPLTLSYVANMEAILSKEEVLKQQVFFADIKAQLETNINRTVLNEQEQIDYDLMQYYIAIHEERIYLELQQIKKQVEYISDKGIFNTFNGKHWYTHYLKRWLNDQVTPEQLFAYGKKEVQRVSGKIEAIQTQLGYKNNPTGFIEHLNKDSFFYNDSVQVQAAFMAVQERTLKNFGQYFPQAEIIPPATIKKGTNPAFGIVPAFYRSAESTFYYNIFDKPFNKRQIDWIYIHEGIPGHHYQITLEQILPRSEIQQLERYPSYLEGWAAYVEELGVNWGLYQTPEDFLGKWEWDIVRSVRVVLDVGINYYGWGDDKALAYWKEHIKNQDDIAEREINRIKRWPAQVITYKYGAQQILDWKAERKASLGNNFKEIDFHQEILGRGSLPISVLKTILN